MRRKTRENYTTILLKRIAWREKFGDYQLGNGSNFLIMSRWLRGGGAGRRKQLTYRNSGRPMNVGRRKKDAPEEREGDKRKPLKFYCFSVDDLERGILSPEGTSPSAEEDMWEEGEPRASRSGTTIRVFKGGYKGCPVDEVVQVSKRRGRRFKFQGREKAKRSQHFEGLNPGRHRRSRKVQSKDTTGGRGGGRLNPGLGKLRGGVRAAKRFLRATRPKGGGGERTKAEAMRRRDRWWTGTEHTTWGVGGRRPQRRRKANRMVDKATRRQGLEGKLKAVMRGIRERASGRGRNT